MFVPKINDFVYDNEGSKLTVMYITKDGGSLATVSQEDEIFVFEKFSNGKYRDQNNEDFFLIGLATDAVWNRFQETQEIEND